MTRDETYALLRTRSALTSQPYSDDVIDAWHEALGTWPFADTRAALVRAARTEKRITVAHIVEQLPQRSTPERRHGPIYDPADGPIMGRDEYLGLLEQRALRGDMAATIELERWQKIIARGGYTPGEPTEPAGQLEAF